ncbi:MAG: cysteine--tRNA ligase [Candidatus Omnitrophica bacterium]|jgi:cysteinyl-tRNA synthetase|nr:cysteine--tRNA ligase [Candidatus Omnitrophota bacterium]
MLKINNTLSRKKEHFTPQNPPHVSMYTCGVTVYDDCHIGHARSLYIFDVMRRYLKYRGYDVKFVRNITDIDDKIINRANELKVNWQELVKKYIERYYEDLNALGIDKADFEPRATENIPDMIKYIQKLIDKDFAYVAAGDVYFNVRKFNEYGKLSGQKIEEMEAGVRISPTELKKDHLDFALWKASKENEPFWVSPWGNGRPGWHIECSVMSQKFLKTETLDIHAGGRDLVFPHHENELAQAEACTGKPFAKYWIHHGLLTINSQKMSKSLGNFVTIKDFINKYKNINLLKLFFLSAHYSHPIDYNQEKIEETKKQKESLDSFFNTVYILHRGEAEPTISDKDKNKIDSIFSKFEEAMDNDFNTAQALSCLFELRDTALSFSNLKSFEYARTKMKDLFNIFNLSVQPQLELLEEQYEDQYQREKLRQLRDFDSADKIRKRWEELGYILEDHKGATAWRKKE